VKVLITSPCSASTIIQYGIKSWPIWECEPSKFQWNYDDKEITIADIPGLVKGAHEGIGLGIQFLKHIERCKSLLHLIDVTNLDLNVSYNQVKNELKSYSASY